ncbi:alpha-1,6-mannosylglycoprotein 6-beta-N-acetylglucosaminyltransferase A [Camelus ferus]|nr:alpha-1,6-mannosylglycoprotein 6-beta-N-acetylglucosaminyltransferase A [Camelus ferus]
MALFTPWKLSSQKLGFFLVTFGFIWGMMLLHFTIQQRTQPESSSMLREQILDLSKRYIKALAEENRNVVDGPYAGVMTAYAAYDTCRVKGAFVSLGADLKKTLAVLLDNILQRIGKLESKVDNLVINGTGTNLTNSTTAVPSLVALEKINVADIINGAQEKCVLPPMDGYPHCEGKIKWMKDMWRSDPCYADYGVDGSTCSFFIYLSEAEIRTDFNILYSMMKKHEEFRWMRLRIRRMADAWIQAIKSLAEKQNLEKRKRKKVLVHLGLLTKESGFKIAETAFSGGPLGELVQWSDLITSLYLLGHDIRISASLAELKEIMKKVVGNRSGCPTVGDRIVELIYIDIVGLAQFKKTLGPSWVHYQCMLRVLDSFGTEPEFNHANYAQSKGHKTPWGKWNLNPQQFYTMFPHTPDNSFLGFVVEQHLNSSDIHHINEIKRQNQSLVYGKVDSFWKNKKMYLDIIHTYMEVHATVYGSSTKNIPSYVKNHGILSGRDLQFLLRETKAMAEGNRTLGPGYPVPLDVPWGLKWLQIGSSCGEGDGTCHQAQTWTLPIRTHSPPAIRDVGSFLDPGIRATELQPQVPIVTAAIMTRTLRCVFAAISCLPWGKRRVCLLEGKKAMPGSSFPPSPHTEGKIKTEIEETFCLVKQVLFQSCLLLFVGLGFPYEGPAPLEAIANGCAFLNPKFNPPKSSKNTDFFIGKPTLREIEPYMPYEFTCEGMLQRINAFIEKQDFCHGQVMWPPLSALQVKLAEPGQSCKQVCQENQLICEPSFFQHLNKDKDMLKYHVICQSSELAKDILVPSFDPKNKHCVFQGDLLLFSCAGAHPRHQRICPCRDFIKGQVALCKDCL